MHSAQCSYTLILFTENCDSKQADIVFVLDASGSEGAANFQTQVEFVRNVTDK